MKQSSQLTESLVMFLVLHLSSTTTADGWEALASLTKDYRATLIDDGRKESQRLLIELDQELTAYGIPISALDLTEGATV